MAGFVNCLDLSTGETAVVAAAFKGEGGSEDFEIGRTTSGGRSITGDGSTKRSMRGETPIAFAAFFVSTKPVDLIGIA